MNLDPQDIALVGDLIQRMLGQAVDQRMRHFVYRVQIPFIASAAVGTSATGTVTIDRGEDFVCTALMVTHRINTTGIVSGFGNADGAAGNSSPMDAPFTVSIGEGSGDRLWSNLPVSALIYSPHGPMQGRLARPQRLVGGTTLNCSVAPTKVLTVAYVAELEFIGYKLTAA